MLPVRAERPGIVRTSTNPMLVYLATLAEGSSRSSMACALKAVATRLGFKSAALLPWHELRYEDVQFIKRWLADNYAPASANRYLAAVRGVLREAYRMGLTTLEDFQRAKDTGSVRGFRVPKGRHVTRGEVRALVEACPADRVQGIRDRALLALLFSGGLRRAEVGGLDLSSIKGAEVLVRGKGNKERTVYLSAGAVRALEDWIRVRGTEPGPLLFPTRKMGRALVRERRLSDHAIASALAVLAERAGVAPFSPHDARRTWVGELFDAGVDMSTVQQLAGHAQVTTTARYDRRGEARKREAADMVAFPYAASE